MKPNSQIECHLEANNSEEKVMMMVILAGGSALWSALSKLSPSGAILFRSGPRSGRCFTAQAGDCN